MQRDNKKMLFLYAILQSTVVLFLQRCNIIFILSSLMLPYCYYCSCIISIVIRQTRINFRRITRSPSCQLLLSDCSCIIVNAITTKYNKIEIVLPSPFSLRWDRCREWKDQRDMPFRRMRVDRLIYIECMTLRDGFNKVSVRGFFSLISFTVR